MEVTRGNFPSALIEISSLLPRSCLVSFDCEFTGLRGNDTREEWEDTPEERYSKLRDGCSEFSLIQYGICLFVKQENEYEVFPFNFYLFPCHSLGRRLDRCFRCQGLSAKKDTKSLECPVPTNQFQEIFSPQPSSLKFLSNSGLDFNKWIREGIPYMRETDELWWRRRRKEAEEPSDEELNQFLGFSRVFKIIADSNIPIVGHSVLLDILHTYTHFIDDLPKALEAFKSEVNKRLTSIYDTLVLCENSSIRACLGSSLSLANVYSALAKPEFPQVTTVFPESCATYGSGNHFHEAAYDAYLSGYVFLMVVRILGGENAVDEFKTVESFKNRVYLFNCESADSLNLTGEEVRAPRDHIFYLTFPREVTTEDIKNLFSPFGGCRVSWINETSARVSLHHRKKAEETYKALAGGGSMGGHLFSISKEQLKPPTSTTNNDETSEKCTLLGKRKKLENTSEAPPTTKVNMFQESVDW